MVRPSIYIGLGGTGILAIAQAKKMFEDIYGVGKIPKCVQFLVFDFDKGACDRTDLATSTIKNDFCHFATATDPQAYYDTHKKMGQMSWMFDNNVKFIDDIIFNGAKQVRTTGRLYTEILGTQIEGQIKSAYAIATSLANTDTSTEDAVDVYLAMSLAGGTGSGAFITIALILRKLYRKKIKLHGFGVLHTVFQAMDPDGNKTPRVLSNAYASIKDLDFLMSAQENRPIELTLMGDPFPLTNPLFDNFYVIDNTTALGKRINDVNELCVVLGNYLFMCGSEAGGNISSVESNVHWKLGNYDLYDKRGWVYGLGAAQIVYHGKELAEVYKNKVIVKLISKMLNESGDMLEETFRWAESAKIREDGNEFNLLTDEIFDPKEISRLKTPNIDIQNSKESNLAIINKYLDNLSGMPTSKFVEEKLKKLKGQLNERLEFLFMSDNGVGNAGTFVSALIEKCGIWRDEMEKEKRGFDEDIAKDREQLDKKYGEYESETTGFFKKLTKTKTKKDELLEDYVALPACKVLKSIYESRRRDMARSIFNGFISHLEQMQVNLTNLKHNLLNIKSEINTVLSRQDFEHPQHANLFEYDLSYIDARDMKLDDSEADVTALTRSLGKSLLEFKDKQELLTAFNQFAAGLNGTKKYLNRDILDLIEELDPQSYDKVKNAAIEKSSLLLQLEDHGLTIKRDKGERPLVDAMVKNLMLMLGKKKGDLPVSRIEKEINEKKFDPTTKFEYEILYSKNPAMKQRVIFFRTDGAIMPFCISAFDKGDLVGYNQLIGNDYEFNPHFDKNIFDTMKRQDFKLTPEDKDEAIFYWACGQLFGWTTIKENARMMIYDGNGVPLRKESEEEVEHAKYICNIKKKYYYWDESARVGKMQKWQQMENDTNRSNAFSYFKENVISRPQTKQQFKQLIKKCRDDKGFKYYEGVIRTIVTDGLYKYIDTLVCADKNSSTYINSTSEWEQLSDEFDYISNNLIQALKNL